MAQHDYIISNGTGSAVRSDLNGALGATVSNNSGATEPATMYAYQWWPDTTSGLLKQRNSANSAWITIGTLGSANLGLLSLAGGTMTGVLAAAAGTAALPGIAFTGDLDSGVFSAGANQFNIATNGVERVEFGTTEVVFNDGGLNYDFRVQGDTKANLFLVDASADAVLLDGDLTLKGQADLRFADSDSSNYIAFQAPASVAADVLWTLPATDGTAGQVISTNGTGTLSFDSRSRLISGTSVASTSGTSIDFTSIPSWVKRVTVMFNNVSLSGSSYIQVQIGSGSVTTTGYSSIGGIAGGTNSAVGVSSTTGFIGWGGDLGNFFMASCVITLLTATTYTAAMAGGVNQAGATFYSFASGGSSPVLSGALDRVRITTLNGTDTFDSGTINILYEG